jgi:hypothetical protein
VIRGEVIRGLVKVVMIGEGLFVGEVCGLAENWKDQ